MVVGQIAAGMSCVIVTIVRVGIVVLAATFVKNIGAGAELGSSECFAAAERGCHVAKSELGSSEFFAAAERSCRAAKAEMRVGVVLRFPAKMDFRAAA